MEQLPTINPIFKSNVLNFNAFYENDNLIFEAFSYDDIDFYDKKYKSINSYKSLTQYQKIFSLYDSLEEIKDFLESLINKLNSNLKSKIRKETNKFIFVSLHHLEN